MCALLARQFPGEPGSFFRRQPRRYFRTVGKKGKDHASQQHCGQAFNHKQPLPSSQIAGMYSQKRP